MLCFVYVAFTTGVTENMTESKQFSSSDIFFIIELLSH